MSRLDSFDFDSPLWELPAQVRPRSLAPSERFGPSVDAS